MRTHLSPAKCYFPTHGINDHFCYIKLTCEPISSNSVSWLSPFIKICAFIWFLRQYQHEHKDCEETCHLHKTSPTNFIPACQTIKLIKLINGPGKEKSQVGPREEDYDHPLSQERVEMSPWGKSYTVYPINRSKGLKKCMAKAEQKIINIQIRRQNWS